MNTDLYERMMDKYGYYQDYIDHIININPQELDSLLKFIIDKYETNKINPHIIYETIAQVCENTLRYVREYWFLYDNFYQHCKEMPYLYADIHIIGALFVKKYDIEIDWYDKYECCKDKDFDEILNYYDSNPIMHCILYDDIKSLKEIIDSSLDFDFNQQLFEKSLIENCCYCGALECFKFLRSNGVDITKRCLDNSILGRNKSIINECLQHVKPDNLTMNGVYETHDFDMALAFNQMYGFEFNLDWISGAYDIKLFLYTLSNATSYDDYFISAFDFKIQELIDDILGLGIDIKAKYMEGKTPLFIAACNDSPEVITKLVELGADINYKDEYGKTALFDAASTNSVSAIEKLVELGAEIDVKSTEGETPIYEAATHNRAEAMIKLIELGADIFLKDENEESVLFLAAAWDNVRAIEKLVERGANIEELNALENTPIYYAAAKNRVKAIEKLIELGANIEHKNENGETPVFYAATHNSVDAIVTLVNHGAIINIKNNDGDTPLGYASFSRCKEAAAKLIELGADPTAKRFDGNPFRFDLTNLTNLDLYDSEEEDYSDDI